MTWTIGDTLELTLHGFAHDGRCVGRMSDGLVVFVHGGLPGRRVLARLDTVKKRMAEGVVLETLATAPEERPAPCAHAAECGGCPWQGLPYAEQLGWKEQLVRDALTRIGRIELPDGLLRPVLPSPSQAGDDASTSGEWGYRNKMEFAFAPGDDEKPLLGLRRRASRQVTEVTQCLLQTPRCMRVLAAIRELVAGSGLAAWGMVDENPPGALRFAVIREPRQAAAAPCLVELITGPVDKAAPQALAIRRLGQQLLDGPYGVSGFVHSIRSSAADVAYGEKTAFSLGDTQLEDNLHLDGYPSPVAFHLGQNAFFQVNTRAAELLYNTAARLITGVGQHGASSAEPESCWDVYCGVGGLSLALAPHFASVLGLESVPAAVALARKNAAVALQCKFETADAARLGEYMRRYGAPTVLAADPPRAGLAPEAVQAILRAKPERLLLVSCNPATLGRDLALLMPQYTLQSIQPVDMFPQTPHVETIVVLTLKA